MKFIFTISALCLLCVSFAPDARAQQNYERQMQRAVQKLTKEIKASENGKYLVRFETSDAATILYFKPTSALWRKLSNAKRIEIAADWWRRFRKIVNSFDEQTNQMLSLDGKKDVHCYAENGVDAVCTHDK